jgi:hypothetical protein
MSELQKYEYFFLSALDALLSFQTNGLMQTYIYCYYQKLVTEQGGPELNSHWLTRDSSGVFTAYDLCF